jgi:hypothetical protein
MRVVRMRLVGIQQLMVNNPQMANPLFPLARRLAALTSKRKKTEEDQLEIQALKWRGSLYSDETEETEGEKIGPYLPDENLWTAIEQGAKKTKEGDLVRDGLEGSGTKLKIEYDGPRDMATMYIDKAGRFVDVRDAKIGRSRIQAARAIFPVGWAIEAEFLFDPEILDYDKLVRFVKIAARRIGIGTYRKKFGRFKVEWIVDLGEFENEITETETDTEAKAA